MYKDGHLHFLTLDRTKEFLFNLRQTFTKLSNLKIPTITAISSLALGGGLELGLCSEFNSVPVSAQPELAVKTSGTVTHPLFRGHEHFLCHFVTGSTGPDG